MPKYGYVLTPLSILVFMSSVCAGPPPIEIRNLSLPEGGWGDKKINFELFSHREHITFIVVERSVAFEGTGGVYTSQDRFSACMEPGFWFKMEPLVTIPGNYGVVTVSLCFYEVVDTLDIVLPEQKFLDTAFSIEIKVPESARPWLKKATMFPPRVDEHPYFDNQFARMMYAMIGEGLSLGDIAQITGADLDYVEANVKGMAGNLYLTQEGQKVTATFPVILHDEAEQVLKLAKTTAKSLTSVVARNCAGYRQALDSLIATRIIEGDSDNVLGTERILFRPYVVVSALLLWNELGTKFITDGGYLAPYTSTDMCNAHIRNFMYSAPANTDYHGHHFFALEREGGSPRLLFAGHIPKIHCAGNFPAKPGIGARAVWKYDPEDHPEYFVYSATTAEPIVEILKKDTDEIISTTLAKLQKIASQWKREKITTGYRYWFWNLVASETLDALVKQKVVEPSGNDNYILGGGGGA